MKKNKRILIFLLTLIICIIILTCILVNNVYKPKYNYKKEPIFVKSIDYIFSKPYLYKGEFVSLSGQVFSEPQINKDYTAFQIYANPKEKQKVAVIYYVGNTNIETGDCISMTGYVYKSVKGENMYGGHVYSPGLKATSLEKKSCIEVFSPTIKELSFTNKKIIKDGYSVEITKVEFAEDETRVYLTVKNNGLQDFNLWYGGMYIIQNNQQYEQLWVENIDYKTIGYQIKPTTTDDGILIFKNIEYDNFTINLEAGLNSGEKTYKYNFSIDIDD